MRTQMSVAALVLSALLVAACGSAATLAPSPSPSPSPQTSEVCAAIADLQASVEAVKEVKPIQDGVEGYKTAIGEVRTDLKAIREAAADELGDQVDAVETAIADLQATLDSVGGSGLGAALTEVGTGVAAVGTAMADLRTEAKTAFTECGLE